MYQSLLISLLLVTPIITLAQSAEPQHAVRIGINRAFFGSGDVVGPALYAEYSYQFNAYLGIAPRVISGFANRQNYNRFDHISSFAANVSARISPLPRYLPGWTIDLGGLYHHFANTNGDIGGPPSSGPSAVSDAYHRQENLWGFVGAMNVDVVHQEKYSLGARLELLTSLSEGYLNADSYQIGLYYSRKF